MSDPLEPLRQEAGRLNEPFSPAVHAKVMTAVRASSPPTVSHAPTWRYALAAAAVVVIALGAWLTTRPAMVPPSPTVASISFDNPLAGVVPPLPPATDGDPALAYLDHDAAQLGRYVLRQLDHLPPPNP